MNRTQQLRNIGRGAGAGGIPGFCAFGLLPLFGFIGFSFHPSLQGILRPERIVRWMERALPLLQTVIALIVYYWVAVLLPMYGFRGMHRLIAATLRTSSVFIGGVCWWQSFIVTYRLLGWLSVVAGLLLAGVGVVPMALFATVLKRQRDVLAYLLTEAALTVVPRLAARFITNRAERMRVAAVARGFSADYEK